MCNINVYRQAALEVAVSRAVPHADPQNSIFWLECDIFKILQISCNIPLELLKAEVVNSHDCAKFLESAQNL